MSGLRVIVPAYRGAAVIARSLHSLASQRYDMRLAPADTGVIVAVNDAGADTFDAAIAFAPRFAAAGVAFDVIRAPRGRVHALTAADRIVPAAAHRVFADQDAALSPGALAALAGALDTPGIEFATLAPRFDRSASRWVRIYCKGWSRLPYVRRSPVTMGLFAVSAAGRRRWDEWPPLAADDKFVRLCFAVRERRLVADESYTVLPPPSRGALIAARARYRRSNRQLRIDGHHDALARHAGLAGAAADPRNWPWMAIVAATELAAFVAPAP